MIGPNPLLERLAAGEAVGAFWLALGSVAAAEVMAETRPHAMIFDMQHGLWDRKSLFEAFAAIRGRSLALVRVAENSPTAIGDALDQVFIGPGDLSLSLGEFPEPGPKQEAALQAILAATRKAKKACGLFTLHAASAVDRVRQGFQLVLLGNDQDFLLGAAKSTMARF